MTIIEKSYISENSGTLNLCLYNDNIDVYPYTPTIRIKVIIGNYFYTVPQSVIDRNLLMFIVTNSELIKDDVTSPNPVFTNVIRVLLFTNSNNDESIVISPIDVYSYKSKLVLQCDTNCKIVKLQKAITTFTFLESMILNAAENGYLDDAVMYYNKMKAISIYTDPMLTNQC